MDSNAPPSYETFLQYRAVILRAIGRAWTDPAFKSALQEKPKTALKSAFRYDFPYDMNLSVLDGSAEWTPAANGGWTNTMQNQVTLVLPPKPEAGQEAVALAEYNANNLTFLSTLGQEHTS